MKKTPIVLAAVLMIFTLSACGNLANAETPPPVPSADLSPEVTTSQTPDPTPSADSGSEGEKGSNEMMFSSATKDFLTPLEEYSSERQYDPEMVVVHFSSAVTISPKDPYNLNTVRQIFTDYKVSAHYVIDRDGTVYCYIPENRVAWHAGKGAYAGIEKYTDKMNHYAIGIELLAIGSQNDMQQYTIPGGYAALDPALIGYTDAQYVSLKNLVSDICTRHNISMDSTHVIGHEDYASRKSDPGELFDWSRLLPN